MAPEDTDKLEIDVPAQIKDSARKVYTRILDGEKPSMSFPIRELRNVRYSPGT